MRFSFLFSLPISMALLSLVPISQHEKGNSVAEENTKPNLTIEEGYVSQKKETILVKREGKTVARIKHGEPIMIARAANEGKCFFQFPTIGKTEDRVLIVSWSFAEDSYVSYGKDNSGSKISFDRGRSWKAPDSYYFVGGSYSGKFYNDEILYTLTPASKDISPYPDFPSAVSDKLIEGYIL